MIVVKVAGAHKGRKYEVLLPAIIDSDGYVTLTHVQAYGAGLCMLAEMCPASVQVNPAALVGK